MPKINIDKLADAIRNLRDYENAGIEIDEMINAITILTGTSRETTLKELKKHTLKTLSRAKLGQITPV